jgi:thiamine biosynthesis protein ThiS
MIKIKVNGRAWEVPAQANVTDLLARFKIAPQVCVVEKNGKILNREEYNKISFSASDEIEIIRMMGGG